MSNKELCNLFIHSSIIIYFIFPGYALDAN